jgi:predicted nucleic acid-binding protein
LKLPKPSSALSAVARMPALDLGPHLIDTSVWIRADRKGHDALKDRLRELLLAGSVWICWPIRAELLIGVKTSERIAILNEQLAALEQAPLLDQTWERAARLGHQLARKGQSVPLPDLLIAATALLHGLPLWSVDSDFKRIVAVAPLDLDLFGAD